jgi:DHA3 family tetracycline resistance protein-like MFS transporter
MAALRMLEPLKHRDFRLLWIGQTVSVFGDFVHTVALPFQVLALGGGAVELGVWGAIYSATSLIFLLFGGAIADRISRRAIILVSDLGSGVVISAIALLAATGALRLEHVYLEAAFFGATHSFFFPALSALIPELVPPEVLQAGNSIRGLSRQIGLLGGPVAGGLLVAVAGLPFAFAFDAATFFVSFAALLFARPPRHEPPLPAPLLRQVREGLAYTFSVPWLWIFIFAWAIVLLGMVGPLNVAMPILVHDVLHGDARLFGTIVAAMGAGEVITGIALAQLKIRRLGVAICIFAAAGGVAVMGIGLITEIPLILVCAAVFGAQFVGVGVLWTTAVQKHVPRELMGRVLSIDAFGGSLLLPIAPVIFAAIVAAVGPSPAFVIGGAIATAIAFLLLLVPSIRALE